VRVLTNPSVVQIELAWYSPSQPDLLFRTGDAFATTGTNGTASVYNDSGWQYCPANSIIVGVRGWANSFVNSVGFACKHLQTGAITLLPIYGSATGSWYEHGCDWSNAAVSTLATQADSRTGVIVDGFKLKCARLTGNTVSWLQ